MGNMFANVPKSHDCVPLCTLLPPMYFKSDRKLGIQTHSLKKTAETVATNP